MYTRSPYDDVSLIASTSAEADRWQLEVLLDARRQHHLIKPKITDAYLNWSTPDLAMWDDLRQADEAVIRRVFPDAGPGVPAAPPFAVMWDISAWERGYRFRFTGPNGASYEFTYVELLRSRGEMDVQGSSQP